MMWGLRRVLCARGRRYIGTDRLHEILKRVEEGELTSEKAASMLQPDKALRSFANLDHTRSSRTGFPEAIFAEGKTPEQIAAILDDMARNVNQRIDDTTTIGNAILATRVTPEQFERVSEIPLENGSIVYHKVARIISMKASGLPSIISNDNDLPRVVVACAGTTDLPVAEEAGVTLEATGCVKVDRVYDVGVAGLHRIIQALPRLEHPSVKCVIVCAGMDGALPSVVGGLVQVPVFAVPTSIGYGASFGGISAMLTMLNSCAPGVGVLNIDNGFGAAALAYKCTTTIK